MLPEQTQRSQGAGIAHPVESWRRGYDIYVERYPEAQGDRTSPVKGRRCDGSIFRRR